MSEFEAGVQYNDMKGTVAADRADNESLRSFLVEQGIAQSDETIAAIRLIFVENPGKAIERPGIIVYLSQLDNDSGRPNSVRSVELDLSTSEFFRFFKRFDLVMIRKGADLSQTEVTGEQYG